ncbi:MAG: hypothetical protein NTW72_00985 [Gemmatimonadetes bacterium]|nr:hypothetical protein [Gemmatimonadota bacterium]
MPFVALAAVSGPLAAQDARVQDVRVQDARDLPPQMPVTFTPPAGLCRIWLDGVPATQQPAPTDCASAIKNRPASASIVFGPKRRTEGSELESFTRRPGSPLVRQLAPNTLAPRRRDDARDRPADSSAKTVRKPEKPQ